MQHVLKQIKPLHENPDFVRAFLSVAANAEGKVCKVCGLERMGHVPESKWLGYAKHDWVPVDADAAMLRHARELTTQAYRMRR